MALFDIGLLTASNMEETFRMITQGLTDIKNETAIALKTKTPEEAVNSFLPLQDDLIRYLSIYSIIQQVVSSMGNTTYKDVKDFLIGIVQQIDMYNRGNSPTAPRAADGAIRGHIFDWIRSLNAEKEETKSLEGSVITDCAVIAPYVGMLSKNEISPISNIHREESHDWNIELRQQAIREMLYILENGHAARSILDHADMFMDIEGPEKLNTVFIICAETNGPMVPVTCYYGWAYLFRNAEYISKADVTACIDALLFNFKRTMKEAMEKVMQFLPADESTLQSFMELQNVIDKFTSHTENVRPLYHTQSDDVTNSFDLQPLYNFLATQGRFISNEYCRRAYLQSHDVKDTMYYDDYIIIMPDRTPKMPLEYVYIPVADILQDMKIVVIKFYLNGSIDVISDEQYHKEMGAGTTTSV